MLDTENKAVAKAMDIPPALLEEILNGNEDALSGVARVQLTYLMEKMTHRCADPNTSPNAVASIMEILRKMAQGNKSAGEQGGPQVVINISRARDNADKVLIEGQAVQVPST